MEAAPAPAAAAAAYARSTAGALRVAVALPYADGCDSPASLGTPSSDAHTPPPPPPPPPQPPPPPGAAPRRAGRGRAQRLSAVSDCDGEGAAPASGAGARAAVASLHSLRLDEAALVPGWRYSSASMRSLASIGMGSTDGRRITVRRVPTSPGDLLNLASSPTDDELSSGSSSTSSWGACTRAGGGGGAEGGEGDVRWARRRPRRQHWANKAQFVLACIGYSVGLGNVWRFPYLCYKSGGGVFLVPYLLALVVCGAPLLYMELAVGQLTRRGPIGALTQLCPIFKGAGLASVVISFLMSTYYNVIIAYALYYFFSAFKADVPWASCGHSWNTPQCWGPGRARGNASAGPAPGAAPGVSAPAPARARTPSEEFYDHKVLQISAGLEQLGGVRWELAACLLCAWVLVYFSLWKGVRSSGRVLYFTATFPYVVILVFLARALTLDGAHLGLQFFFKPQWERLAESKVWVNALAQNFNSFGIAFGSVISFASYNRFHNQILVDTLAVTIINAFTSILVGIFAFATIGNIASEMGKKVEDVVADGPGLVFVVYPQAMTKMPAIQLWAVLFFFMLLCLALNSQFAIVEVVVTSLQDGFPLWVRRRLRSHEALVLMVCAVSFVFGLPNVTEGGMYFFQLLDHFAASISIMYLAFFEVVAVAWLYGARRLARDVRAMTGRRPSLYILFCWCAAAPLLLLAVWVFSLYDYEPPSYDRAAYRYPAWAEALGWAVASLSLLCIPVCAAVVVARAPGHSLMEKLSASVRPRVATACAACANGCSTGARHDGDAFSDDAVAKEVSRELSTLLSEKEPPPSAPSATLAPPPPT